MPVTVPPLFANVPLTVLNTPPPFTDAVLPVIEPAVSVNVPFLLAPSSTGSWMHARAGKARHLLARFEPKRIADGLERGAGLSIDEVAFRVFGIVTSLES